MLLLLSVVFAKRSERGGQEASEGVKERGGKVRRIRSGSSQVDDRGRTKRAQLRLLTPEDHVHLQPWLASEQTKRRKDELLFHSYPKRQNTQDRIEDTRTSLSLSQSQENNRHALSISNHHTAANLGRSHPRTHFNPRKHRKSHLHRQLFHFLFFFTRRENNDNNDNNNNNSSCRKG